MSAKTPLETPANRPFGDGESSFLAGFAITFFAMTGAVRARPFLGGTVAGVAYVVVVAFAELDGGEERAELPPGVLDGALLRVAHPVLDLGEGLLDRIEVWRVRRQESQPCTGLTDCPADGLPLVAAEVVEDHEVTGPERRHQELFDPGLEGALVDRPVEHARRAQPVPAQVGQEGQGVPAPVRCEALQAMALRRPAP